MKFDEPSLPAIVALQLGGEWTEALNRLVAIRKHEFFLLSEANRAVCLFHLQQFEKAAVLAPGLARIYPTELTEYDVNRLMMSLVVIAMVAHHRVGNNAEACRFALELCHHFDLRVGDLPFIPKGILLNSDGTLTIHETTNGRLIVFALFCLQFEANISDKERREIAGLLEGYARLDPSDRTAYEVFEEVLLNDDTPCPQIDLDAARRLTQDDSDY